MTFFNRYVVAGSSGLIHLSVPLVHGRHQKTTVESVEISYAQNWQTIHWRTLEACYRKSPWFEYYATALQPFFTEKWPRLFDWNQAILEWLIRTIPLDIQLEVKAALPEKEFLDVRGKWTPKNFQSETEMVYYPQVFEDRIGFQKNLSILDLLFNMGPHTADVLLV